MKKFKKKIANIQIISKIANVSAEFLLKKPSSIYFSSFKLIKRNIVNEIVKYTGPFPFIDGLILSITFQQ